MRILLCLAVTLSAAALTAQDVSVATNVVKKPLAPAPASLKDQVAGKPASRPTRITSRTTYYDRKGEFAVFTGHVHVDDERYQMHAEKAFVFFGETNQLKRLVAVGNVALTNDTKRAYGSKVAYYRETGMVVLHSDKTKGAPAEVRDVAKKEDQVVRGSKIRFWIDREQVEVVDADIAAPSGGVGNLSGLKP